METGTASAPTAPPATDDRVDYEQAYRLFVALENPRGVSDTNSAAFQQMLQRALALMRQALRQRQLDGVLSDNERFFELQNEQLYAFLLEYFLAMLAPKLTFFQSKPNDQDARASSSTSSRNTSDQEDNVRTRIRFLHEADVFHTQFLDRAETMGLLTESKRREQYERMDGKKFTLSREQKIERFKLQRDMEQKLAAVQERKSRLRKGEDDDDLEEVEREQLMTFIQLSVVKSLEEQTSVNQERDMLETMVKMNAKTDERDLFTDAHRPPPPPQGQGISVTHINPQFEMRREVVRSEVFQPGHRLPTMSLEEYADREYADAVERQQREAEGPVGPRRYDQLVEDGDEDDHALLNEATYKDRAWDDYKDANPRGIGNKKGSQF